MGGKLVVGSKKQPYKERKKMKRLVSAALCNSAEVSSEFPAIISYLEGEFGAGNIQSSFYEKIVAPPENSIMEVTEDLECPSVWGAQIKVIPPGVYRVGKMKKREGEYFLSCIDPDGKFFYYKFARNYDKIVDWRGIRMVPEGDQEKRILRLVQEEECRRGELENKIVALIKASKRAKDYPKANVLFGVLMEIVAAGYEPEEKIRLEVDEESYWGSELMLRDEGEYINGIHYYDLLYVKGVCIPMPLLRKKAKDFLDSLPLQEIEERDFSINHGGKEEAVDLTPDKVKEIERVVTQFPQWESWVKLGERK